MRRLFFTMMLFGIIHAPANAQNRFDIPVTGEVLPGWVQADGSRMIALRLTLAPGWKTYWRAPGDAGIPPEFSWTGSSNMKTVSINWPAPMVFEQNGMRSVGYENSLVIPLRIEPNARNKPMELKATMALGVCADVCIPHELEFAARLDDSNLTPTPAIAAALAQRPYSASEAGVQSAKCRVSPTTDGLEIEAHIAMPSAGGDEYVVIEPGVSNVWVSEAETRRSGGTVIATSEMVNINGGPVTLDRSAIRMTVLGSKYAVDIRGCAAG